MSRRTRFRIFATTTTLVVTALALGLLTAGELEPPVPPGTPTMKPLPDLEPRHAIWAGMLPLTITQDGSSWYLAENITTTGGGITIAANDVTIDLMGHRLEGGTGIGIRDDAATAQRAGTTIKNGCVRNWGSHGISLDFRATVINVSAMENVGNGIQISEYGRFIDCRATFNSGHGLDVGGKAYVSGCQTHFNSENGILMNDGFVVNVSAVGNYRNGIRVWGPSVIRDSSWTFNDQNQANGGAGIWVAWDFNRIEGNHFAGNNISIHLDGNNNMIVRNTVSQSNGPVYDVDGGATDNYMPNFTIGTVGSPGQWDNLCSDDTCP